MPVYTIQQDQPWTLQPIRGSYAPSASVYSEDYEGPKLNHPDMPRIAPLHVQKPHHPSYHAHSEQKIKDHGPQTRGSRLPLFKQVRSMLQKPTALDTRGNITIKYDEFTGDMSESGRAPQIKPSTYKNPYEGVYQTRRQQSPTRKLQKQAKSLRSISPVSVLREDELVQTTPTQYAWDHERPPSPVSPVSVEFKPTQSERAFGPTSHATLNARALPETPPNPSTKLIERKPAPSGRLSQSPENIPPLHLSASRDGILSAIPEAVMEHRDPGSHFSWTTTATTPPPSSPHTSKHSHHPSGEILLPSRFSWSTVKTQTTTQERQTAQRAPSPPPPIPTQYKSPPVQSILSRHRPVQRLERDLWAPSQRKASPSNSAANTPKSAKSKIIAEARTPEENTTGSAKKLPPPPELCSSAAPMSHLETLLVEERDKAHRRRNIERAILELEKKEQASPMEVDWADLKDAKKRLGEMRASLAEVQLEERDIGIAISRARRREGEEEGLWVRRVTG